MPNKCCVPGCKGNYNPNQKVPVFSFPRDSELRRKWTCAIPRKDFVPSNHTKVCEIHFRKEDLIWFSRAQDSVTGKVLSVKLGHPRLKADAVPVNFPNCPNYLSSKIKYRASREEKQRLLDESRLQTVKEQSIREQEKYQKSISYTDYSEFLSIFDSFNLPNGWFSIKNADGNIIIFKTKYAPGPVITYSIIINSELRVEAFLFGEEIHISVGSLKTPFTTSKITELQYLLEKIIDPYTSTSENISNSCNPVIEHISELMDTIIPDNPLLSFLHEQLKLHVTAKERYRYSMNTVFVSSILYTISPHAYKFLRHFGCVILPHPTTITGICNKFLADPTAEDRQAFLRYAKNIFRHVDAEARHMILLMDEIHIQPYMDYKGGNVVGNSCHNTDLAVSCYVFMLNSIKSDFKEVIHIAPVSHINHDTLHSFIETLILGLEEIGYKIICVISDNNAINSKAMSNFSKDKNLSIVYPHPFDHSRPLFFMFDSVHLLKCIRNNWLNSKPEQVLTYPDMSDFSTIRTARFQAVRKLHELEHDKLLKFGYSLNVKALFPSNIEKQNVKLALKIFNSFVIEGLKQFGSNITNSDDTAIFIGTILRWWHIVNVKTPLKGKRLNDPYQEPIIADRIDDPKLVFLNNFLDWLDEWKQSKYSHKLTNQTHTALTHTVYCMLEIVKYCFHDLKMNYILLGKFQTDPLERRFGKYCQLAGGHYNISIRQLYECEKRLRIQSQLTLKSQAYGNISIKQFYEDDDRLTSEENFDNYFSPVIAVEDEDFESIMSEMPVVTYLGGYCCYVALRKVRCDTCKNIIVFSDELIVEDSYDLIRNLNRGCLLFPKEQVVNLVSICYIIFNKILQDCEEEFLSLYAKRNFLCRYILCHNSVRCILPNFDGCATHNGEKIIKIIVCCVVNTLLKNYCGKRNNFRSKGKSKKASTFN